MRDVSIAAGSSRWLLSPVAGLFVSLAAWNAARAETPITIPLDPPLVLQDEPRGGSGTGFVERPEGTHLYESATGRVLALLPRLTVEEILASLPGERLDRPAQLESRPPLLEELRWPPLSLADQPAGAPATGDINGDGRLEIVLTLTGGGIVVLDSEGLSLPGWPLSLEAPIHHGATLVDLNDDGRLEILVATEIGNVHAFTGSGGAELPGWPVCIESSGEGEQIWAPPLPADLDGNGSLEVFVCGTEGTMQAFATDGRPIQGWPVRYAGSRNPSNPAAMYARPAVEDIEGDGEIEIVTGLNSGAITATDADGAPALGWPHALADHARAGFGPVAVADIDGLRGVEIIAATDRGFPGKAKIVALRPDGRMLRGWPATLPAPAIGGVALADLDGNGRTEVIAATIGGNGEVWALRGDGKPAPGWPIRLESTSFVLGPLISNLDGRPGLEVAILGTTTRLNAGAVLAVVDASGKMLPGFPLTLEGAEAFQGGMTVADLDADGRLEFLVAVGGIATRLYAFSLSGSADGNAPWPRTDRGPESIARNAPRSNPAGPPPPIRPNGDEPSLALGPSSLALDPNTTISFSLSRPATIDLRVVDVQGIAVRTVLRTELPIGVYAIAWDGTNDQGEALPTGVYFFELGLDGEARTRQLAMLLR